MGGAVSSGRDNNELIDNLMGGKYIRTRPVERVFRSLDRADYMTPESRDQAYKDLAWRNGPLHMSAPCIYSEVLEGLELRPGLSFLNVGSGTGYFSTLVGLLIGPSGINHGIEVHPYVLDYAVNKLSQFIENSPTLDEFDFCEPRFYFGNGLSIPPLTAPYDRLYCGAACPEQYQNYFKQLIKVGGVLVMPLNDNLVQIKRTGPDAWSTRSLLNVSFASLQIPTEYKPLPYSARTQPFKIPPLVLDEQCPARLQVLARAVVRRSMRAALLARHPHLREPPAPPPRPAAACPRRICIPIEDDSDVEGLNALHDLDQANGANEMNALLSLVLSMGQNRVAGALRFDSLDSPSDSDTDDNDDDNDGGDGPDDDEDKGDGGGGGDAGGGGGGGSGDDDDDAGDKPLRASRPHVRTLRAERPARAECVTCTERAAARASPAADAEPEPEPGTKPARACRGLLTFEFQDAHRDLPRSSTSTSTEAPEAADDSTKTDDGQPEPLKVPAEVEIYLGKEVAGSSRDMEMYLGKEEAGTSRDMEIYLDKEVAGSSRDMEWDGARESSSSEDSAGAREERKRKKLDSGIGEGTTTSSSASPAKSECAPDHEITMSDLENDPNLVGGLYYEKRVPLKRSRRRSSQSSSDGSSYSAESHRRRRKRRAAAAELAQQPRPRRAGADARRVRLSILMKRGVKELPLPYALKKYVNLGRCFEF